MIDIKDLQNLASDSKNIIITEHMHIRLKQRKIKFFDLKKVLLTGEIIEQYPTGYPYPCCLVLGTSSDNKAIHICTGLGENKLWIITGYYPDLDKWEKNYKTRKAVK
ncbi:MAG: DUF4258 domain-containing protein [Firmicutes bacterium]|nr:DUF4258 domain-containing protein [[Eubacterium] siraeum]MCM1488050.1 DUF4258 domain-containing protein [Bacillota bacterium]